MKIKYDDVVVNVEERLGQDKAYTIDSSKAREKLQWFPKISIEEGLKQTIDWVESNFELISNLSLNYQHKE